MAGLGLLPRRRVWIITVAIALADLTTAVALGSVNVELALVRLGDLSPDACGAGLGVGFGDRPAAHRHFVPVPAATRHVCVFWRRHLFRYPPSKHRWACRLGLHESHAEIGRAS